MTTVHSNFSINPDKTLASMQAEKVMLAANSTRLPVSVVLNVLSNTKDETLASMPAEKVMLAANSTRLPVSVVLNVLKQSRE